MYCGQPCIECSQNVHAHLASTGRFEPGVDLPYLTGARFCRVTTLSHISHSKRRNSTGYHAIVLPLISPKYQLPTTAPTKPSAVHPLTNHCSPEAGHRLCGCSVSTLRHDSFTIFFSSLHLHLVLSARSCLHHHRYHNHQLRSRRPRFLYHYRFFPVCHLSPKTSHRSNFFYRFFSRHTELHTFFQPQPPNTSTFASSFFLCPPNFGVLNIIPDAISTSDWFNLSPIMPSSNNLPSSFASAAAGQITGRDARGGRADGRGSVAGDWYATLLFQH